MIVFPPLSPATFRLAPLLPGMLLLATCVLAGCATVPAPTISREGDLRAAQPAGAGDAAATRTETVIVDGQPRTLTVSDPGSVEAQPRLRPGTGIVIDRAAAAAPPPGLGATSGAVTFNFEGESLHAVAKAILGDMLGQNYVIAPGVQGTVTLATPDPVSPAEALSLLEMVLGWNGARMVYSDGRYNIVPADQGLAGTVAPRTGPATDARGYETRVVPLRYISATEMEKLLEPYARENAIVHVDPSRNVITVAGTRAELENYLRTIQVFDVDWLAGMSVGVFPLQSGKATRVVEDLEKVFGEDSGSPVAGMFRFMPLEGANAVLVITPQPAYLGDIRQWLERIDGAGEGVQLFSYQLKYIKAADLARRLAEVFSGAGAGTGGEPSLMTGLQSSTLKDEGLGDRDGGAPVVGGNGQGLGEGQLSLDPREAGDAAVTLEIDGDAVGVSAVEETNTLLVRTSPQAWRSILDVVDRIDVMPMQVHIEAQVAEVKLTGDLEYGVNWYFENAVSDPPSAGGAGLPNADGRGIWGDLAGRIVDNGLSWTFLGRNAAAVISALDEVTDVRLLQTPSLIVRNNAEGELNVGTSIPVSSVSFDPISGGTGTVSQVQYLDTGVILKVRPRITRDGMVFLDIVQEVSSPGPVPANCDINCNVPIDTRRLKTEAAVQSGETVMLAGLISEGVTTGSSGVPGLSRIPVIGSLFGTRRHGTDRSEVIVLLTPTVIRNPMQARELTDEYSQRFRSLEPLRTDDGADR